MTESTGNIGQVKDRHKAVPAVYLILHRDGGILLSRRINTGYYDGWYTVPSGHIEAGELPLQAMAREAMEEISITFDPAAARLVHTMYRAKHDKTGERVDLFFLVEQWQGEPQNREPHKCDELRWFSLDALPANLMHHVAIGIRNWRGGMPYAEIPFTPDHVNPNHRSAPFE
ncbi:NUDIX domain-containing protein [Candidatus Parcubacteria bacterium]|nr:MAG: NUDIX domain-containing protein [Candidatus Parcubacteria bacterium]